MKKELTGELLEYRDCRLMAEKLSHQTEGFDRFVREPTEIEADPTYTRLHEPSELLRAYMSAVGKRLRKLPPPVEAFRGIVATKIVSVESKIKSIYYTLKRKGKKQRFRVLFADAQSRSDLVATFLAVLELAKAKKLRVEGDGDTTDVELLTEDFGDFGSKEWG